MIQGFSQEATSAYKWAGHSFLGWAFLCGLGSHVPIHHRRLLMEKKQSPFVFLRPSAAATYCLLATNTLAAPYVFLATNAAIAPYVFLATNAHEATRFIVPAFMEQKLLN
jgi:hypothetical protein